MLSFHTRVGLYHLFFPDIFPLMPLTTLHQHHMKDLAFQQISEFLVIFFSTICRDGINEFCFPCLPQIHSIPKGKVNLNIYKLSRLLIMINITTSRAEMLQNVTTWTQRTFTNTRKAKCSTTHRGAAAGLCRESRSLSSTEMPITGTAAGPTSSQYLPCLLCQFT